MTNTIFSLLSTDDSIVIILFGAFDLFEIVKGYR